MTERLPATMRAVVWTGADEGLVVRTLPVPSITDAGGAVLRVDVAMFGAALVRAVTVGHARLRPPQVLGTLVVGEVVYLADEVDHLQVGDVVTIDPHPPCGHCRLCFDGAEALCASRPGLEPGAHAEYVRIDPSLVAHARRLPRGMDVESAVLTEIVACVLDATRQAAVGAGQQVVVVGCGPVAMIQIQLARLAGARQVVCTVNRAERVALVERFGAVAVDVREPDAEERVRDATDGGGHVVIEAVGRAASYEQALRLVRPQGVVVGFGGCPLGTSIEVDINALHYNRISFVGSYHYRAGAFDEALALLGRGEVDVRPLISHRLSLDDLPDIGRLVDQDDCMAVLVRPAGTGGTY